MSRAMALYWFPTLCPDIPVKLVLGIGKLSPPGKAMRKVVELDMRPKSPTNKIKASKNNECAIKDACFLVLPGPRMGKENKTEIQIGIPLLVDMLFYLKYNGISEFLSNKGMLLLLTTSMLNIPYSVLMQFPFGIN